MSPLPKFLIMNRKDQKREVIGMETESEKRREEEKVRQIEAIHMVMGRRVMARKLVRGSVGHQQSI